MRGGGYERKGEERWEDKGNGGNWRDEPRGEEEVTCGEGGGTAREETGLDG